MIKNTLSLRLRRTTVIAALFLLAALSSPTAAAEPTEVEVGISAQVVTMFPLWMAEVGGLYQKEGLKVQVVTMEGGTRGIQVLLSGKILAMHVGLAPVVQANKQGADLRMIASSANTIPFTIFSAPDVKTAADLKGGTVGVSTFGSESDIAVTLALKRLGLSRKDVTIVQMGGTSQRLAALLSGQAKAVPLLEPATTTAREQGLNALVDLAAANVPWVFDGLVVRRGQLDSQRALLTRLLRAYIGGAYLALADEKRAKELIAAQFKTSDAKVINATYNDFKRLMPLDAEPSRAGAENVIAELQAIGVAVGSRNPEDHLDSGIIQTLKKEGFFTALKRQYGMAQ
ncbi:MAG TPA: ABC transporter substrate-binding protein [Verrucomicrobiae bacterium]|jgi:NitT/TauT family transport system substrate-binding protein|nr:ABC transporter substrate-binding protein [Verrucomicrobiae bacterium]